MTKTRTLPKRLESLVNFARWCNREKIDPLAAAELIHLAERAFKAGETACNSHDPNASKREQKAGEKFEKAATALGFSVSWPGLYPTLSRGGYDVYLPEVK